MSIKDTAARQAVATHTLRSRAEIVFLEASGDQKRFRSAARKGWEPAPAEWSES